MTRKSKRTLLSLILSMMLIVAMAFNMTACSDNNTGDQELPQTGTEADAGTEVDTQGESDAQADANTQADANVVGEGDTVFDFVVVDKDGNETTFEVHTDKTTVGEALLELDLIDGEDGDYGLYVKTVNGITVDYDVDGTYWAFYINGEYASTGVDVTPITEGEIYSFKVE